MQLNVKKFFEKHKIEGIRANWLKNFVLVSVIIVSVVSLIACLLIRWYYYNSVSMAIESLDTNLVQNYFSGYINTTKEQFESGALKFVEEFSEKDKMEVWVINESGEPVVTSSGFGISENPVMPDYTDAFSNSDEVGKWIGDNEYGERVMALTIPIEHTKNGEHSSGAALRYLVSLEDIDSQLLVIYLYIFIAAVVIILIIIVVSPAFAARCKHS